MDRELTLEEIKILCRIEISKSLSQDPPQIPDERILKLAAQDLWALGRITESLTAIDMLERLEELTPRELNIRAYWQLYLGQMAEARATFETLLEKDSQDPAAHLGYAFTLFYLDDYQAAEQVFQQLIDEGLPFTSPPVMAAACRAMRAGQQPEQIQVPPLPGLPKWMGEILQLRILEEDQSAIRQAEAVLSNSLSDEDRLPIERALIELLIEADLIDLAFNRLNDLLKQFPEDGPLWYFQGIAARRLGQRNPSHKAFSMAIFFAPLESRAWGGFGAGLLERRQSADALKAYQVALFLDSKNVNFWGDLGLCQSMLNQWREARDSFSQAIKLGAATFNNYLNRGVCSENLGDSHEAFSDFQMALVVDPNHRRAGELRQRLYGKDGSNADDRFVFGDASETDTPQT